MLNYSPNISCTFVWFHETTVGSLDSRRTYNQFSNGTASVDLSDMSVVCHVGLWL